MSETTPKGQDFESALEQASQSAAEFDGHRSGFIPSLQHLLHTNPSLVPLIVLVLRVHRLAEPLTVPVRDHYAGCTSWTPMSDLPPDPREAASTPVLDDAAFAERRAALHAALPGVTFEAPEIEA